MAGIVAILEGMKPGEEKETAMTFPTDGEPHPPACSCAHMASRCDGAVAALRLSAGWRDSGKKAAAGALPCGGTNGPDACSLMVLTALQRPSSPPR